MFSYHARALSGSDAYAATSARGRSISISTTTSTTALSPSAAACGRTPPPCRTHAASSSRTRRARSSAYAIRYVPTPARRGSGCSDLGRVAPGDREVDDEAQDRAEEQHARTGRPEPQATVARLLREAVADRGAQRAGEDVRQPEGEDRVEPEEVMGRCDDGDRGAEDDRGLPVAEAQPLCRE